ncbi:formate--tetrahydrofolate ligase [Aliikangiella coralliicola]|uniref:Formate--tetrahydrofolate ligase n=1 Tax=Aliikangiella coralliicola TaxID=2592383 RepID=A0A545UII0_9GAMM|nr:formate--tetrahydrofolate ligase [Aliikangiella coralliicola]TQV89243.1 formate--tetrahydrofolate ligase [Aliikangiella coralliicola]
MLNDAEIVKQFKPKPIVEVAKSLGIDEQYIMPYGSEITKIHADALKQATKQNSGKLILVSATTPTPAGEGKTTTTIGLGQAFTRLGDSVCLALREPSLGPCLGMKGGATGGGYSQVVPVDRINLHFTGDFHAITSANNLISASIDNHIYHGNALNIDPRQIVWRRVMDMNDRSLRKIVLGLGGKMQGIPREGGFDITAASEVMAILCLAKDFEDLENRLDNTLIGYSYTDEPVFVKALGITGALLALLRDALHPNLVQSLEGTPTFIHGGPFANIAHGCNSVLATKMAMHHAEWAITEAGFGFDLGAEKFFDIKCRLAELDPAAVVLVTTVRALKMHGGMDRQHLTTVNTEFVKAGLENLDKHIESVQLFNKTPVVALNRFADDSDEEIAIIRDHVEAKGILFAESNHFTKGGEGAIELAEKVKIAVEQNRPFKPLYELRDSVVDKIKKVCKAMYGARDVAFTKEAEVDLHHVEHLKLTGLPICIAKAPSSLSDDPLLHGRPRDFQVTVRNIQVNAGAGFLVVLTGKIMRMPGLPKEPAATKVELLEDGEIIGVS